MTEARTTRAGRADGSSFGSLGWVVGALVLTWAASLASRPLNDNSFLTHLATGRLILSEGRVPSADPYTFTARGEPWTVQSWLASVGYASMERLAGTAGIRLLVVLVYLAAAWCLWRLTRPAASLIVRLGLVAVAMAVSTGLWTERPYMVGVVGVAVVMLALDDEVPWWTLVPAMWVWGNAHGSFIVAPALVSAFLVGGALDRGRERWRDVPAVERRMALAVGVGTLLPMLGPLGLRAVTFPFVAADRSDVFSHVTEWQSPEFRSASELAYLVLVVVVVAALARWGRQWRDVLPAVAMVAASMYAQRNIVMAVVVLVAVGARVVPAVGTLRSSDRPRMGGLLAGATGGLVVVVAIGSVASPARALDDYAAGALAYVEAVGLDSQRTASDVFTGNALEVLDGVRAEAFVDDRFDMLPVGLFEDYLVLDRGRPGWEQVLDRYGIDVVVWPRQTALGSLLASAPGWRIGYSDASSVVAVRR